MESTQGLALVNNEVLGEWFPAIQISSTIDQRGVVRLQVTLSPYLYHEQFRKI